MKKILSLVLLFTATSALADIPMPADKCLGAAKTVAKMNTDQKARALGFKESSVGSAKLVGRLKTRFETLKVYSVDANIYKGSYKTEVILDSSCGVESVSIKENL